MIRNFFMFIVVHYDIITIILLSFSVISLSIKLTKQETAITELKKELFELQFYKNKKN